MRPWLCSHRRRRSALPARVAGPRNPVVGIREKVDYRAGGVMLSKGSALLLYTDGITEAARASGEQFGEERLLATLNQSRRAGAAALIDDTLSAVHTFSAGSEQSDDITLLALRFVG